jgi:hypothetical protein
MVAAPSGVPILSQIRCASSRFAEPAKIFISGSRSAIIEGR